MKPDWILRMFTKASDASIRRRSDSLDISSEKMPTTRPSRSAACCAMLMAHAVLPMEGRAAMMMSSAGWRPLVMRSKSLKCVARPVTSRFSFQMESMVPKCSLTMVGILAKSRVMPRSETASRATFGGVENFERFLGLIDSLRHRRIADVDELAEERFVLDDADVFFDGDAARQAFGEGCDVGDTADRLDFLFLRQLFDQRDQVDVRVRR